MAVRSRAARFALYGALGLCAELAFTGLKGLGERPRRGLCPHLGLLPRPAGTSTA